MSNFDYQSRMRVGGHLSTSVTVGATDAEHEVYVSHLKPHPLEVEATLRIAQGTTHLLYDDGMARRKVLFSATAATKQSGLGGDGTKRILMSPHKTTGPAGDDLIVEDVKHRPRGSGGGWCGAHPSDKAVRVSVT